jgi:L-galactose dehydrogenase/L-glyceraldehyde 3-phosphate reductase
MKYRELGKTGVQISEIVYGAGAVGGLLIREDPETRLEAVRRALDYGINWFDTAPAYGNGQSERNLGSALKELGANPHVSTKVGIRREHLADIPGEVQHSLEASLRRLQRDSVDMIILHSSIGLDRGAAGLLSIEDVLGKKGVVDGFERVREQGLVRFLGFSAGGDAEALHHVIDSGQFDTAQVFHSVINPSAGRLVPEDFPGENYRDLIGRAAREGVGVLNIRVLAAGAVVGPETDAIHGRDATPGVGFEQALVHAAKVRDALNDEEGTIVQKAIRFALANPGVSGVLVGFGKLEHIGEAVGAVEIGPLPDSALRRLDDLFVSNFGGRA